MSRIKIEDLTDSELTREEMNVYGGIIIVRGITGQNGFIIQNGITGHNGLGEGGSPPVPGPGPGPVGIWINNY